MSVFVLDTVPYITLPERSGHVIYCLFFKSFAILISMSLKSLLSFCCMLFGAILREQKDLYALYTHFANETQWHNYFWHSLTD